MTAPDHPAKTTDKPPLIALMGPTAAGKTSISLELAVRLNGEIISADAVSVYRGLDIGSAKPDEAERALARHHLIDVAGPEDDFNAADFARLAGAAVEEILARGKTAIVAGGTGLYFKALLHGLFQAPQPDQQLRDSLNAQARQDPARVHARLAEVDPESAARLAVNDSVRVVRALEIFLQTGRTMSHLQAEHRFKERPYNHLKLGLAVDREILAQRIQARAEAMFASGLLEEVRQLLAKGVDPSAKPMQSIGYRQAVDHLQGRISLEEALESTVTETRRLAKRQMTWFRGDQEILWLPADDISSFIDRAKSFLESVK